MNHRYYFYTGIYVNDAALNLRVFNFVILEVLSPPKLDDLYDDWNKFVYLK